MVREAGFSESDTARAQTTIASFRRFIEENRDEIAALRILYSQPYGQRQPTYEDIKDLAARLQAPPRSWTPDTLWEAYARLERDKVRGLTAKRVLTDVVSLVRH